MVRKDAGANASTGTTKLPGAYYVKLTSCTHVEVLTKLPVYYIDVSSETSDAALELAKLELSGALENALDFLEESDVFTRDGMHRAFEDR
jgi:hypothetical protein